MILLRKRDLIALSFSCAAFLVVSFMILSNFNALPAQVFSPQSKTPATVVIDAGHGGEDGGAVSGTGVKESHLNLVVAQRIDELFRFTGNRTVMTRREDVSICDDGLNTIRKRKASDLQNRVTLVNTTPYAILISIHQNSLPSSVITRGAQVFWNTQDGAQELAVSIQDVLNAVVNTGNEKQAKSIPNTIYLTKHALAPSVVVECGFLSNPEETALLQQSPHQLKLAVSVTAGYLRCLKGEPI